MHVHVLWIFHSLCNPYCESPSLSDYHDTSQMMASFGIAQVHIDLLPWQPLTGCRGDDW